MASMTLTYILLSAAGAMAEPQCDYDASTLLALPFTRFDQDLTGGWRALANRGCHAAAAEVIRRYRSHHRTLGDNARSVLLWHEGQALASMGDHRRAVPLLLAGVPVDDATGFADYALGTVAFLLRDRPALLAARARLAALPKPADWADHATATVNGQQFSISVTWPPNLSVLDSLIECFDRPYAEAYVCCAHSTGVDPASE